MAVTESLLRQLLPSARVALPFVEQLVEEGLNTTEIQEALSAAGMGVRRTDLLALVRGVRDVAQTRPYLGSVRDDRRPDPSRLATPVTDTLRTYSFRVRLTGTDSQSGETLRSFIIISSDTLLTAGEIKERALAMIPSSIAEVGPGSMTGPLDNPTAIIDSGTIQE